METAVKPEIKVDRAESKPMAEMDEYEEDTDLHIPEDAGSGAWLTRVPPELWKAWHDMYQNAPANAQIEIGEIRLWNKDNGDPDVELHLKGDHAQTSEVPQKYHLKINAHRYNNSVVFSEKDLPGHKSQSFGRNRFNNNNKTSSGVNKHDRYNNNNNNNNNPKPDQPKTYGGYRSVIPKHVSLAAKISNETTLVPVEDETYYTHLERSLTQAMAPKVGTTFTLGIDRSQQTALFTTFTTSSKPASKAAKKKLAQKEKYVRMSEPDLLNALYACFRRYKYWSLKALRQELKQPETFIKENLEKIANLIRSGDFAMTWRLQPGYEQILAMGDEEVKQQGDVAKVESGDEGMTEGTGDDGDEDDIGEMEDVKMDG